MSEELAGVRTSINEATATAALPGRPAPAPTTSSHTLLRNDYAAEQVLQQDETSNAAEIDERARVGDNDHRDSSVATSFFRSSTE